MGPLVDAAVLAVQVLPNHTDLSSYKSGSRHYKANRIEGHNAGLVREQHLFYASCGCAVSPLFRQL